MTLLSSSGAFKLREMHFSAIERPTLLGDISLTCSGCNDYLIQLGLRAEIVSANCGSYTLFSRSQPMAPDNIAACSVSEVRHLACRCCASEF